MTEETDNGSMKLRVARTLKWNVADKIATQFLYGVTGIILARVLTQTDFGLVGAVLVFQAFATLFVDSGFSYALIQRKSPTHEDYSTVLWFNMGTATAIYVILFILAPWIPDLFQGDERLVSLSRVMFLTFILNASAIVQTNRLMKRMEVKMIAVSNSVGLIVSAVVAIILALSGFGAWAIVWQNITLSLTKSLILWLTSDWRPLWRFSGAALKSFTRVGFSVMGSSFLNVLFQNIYSFFIGNRVGLVSLGYYTQADKWSKMGISSLSSIVTSSFLPALSQYQDDTAKFAASTAKMNRLTAYILFPSIGLLIVASPAIFHSLFGHKWDASIALFQLLLIRGIFTVLSSLYNNYILALGHGRRMMGAELTRDIVAFIAILITLPYIALSSPVDFTEGVRIFLWGQVIASALTWGVYLVIAVRLTVRTIWDFVIDLLPYVAESFLVVIAVALLQFVISNPWLLMLSQGILGAGLYILINYLAGSRIQLDALSYLTGRKGSL